MNTTNPQPAKTPITSKHAGIAISHPHFAPIIEDMAALERTLAEREAEVAEQKRWLVAASKDLEESREKRHAAEERAQRAEKSETALSELNRVGDREIQEALSYLGEFVGNDSWTQAVQRMSLTLLSVSRDCNVLRRRLATVADEIEKTGVVEALKHAENVIEGAHQAFVTNDDSTMAKAMLMQTSKIVEARRTLTAFVAKLRENKL